MYRTPVCQHVVLHNNNKCVVQYCSTCTAVEKVVLALELLDKFVKCWTRAQILDFCSKRQVEYGGLCNNKLSLPGFVW
jgi:hypothetical protein